MGFVKRFDIVYYSNVILWSCIHKRERHFEVPMNIVQNIRCVAISCDSNEKIEEIADASLLAENSTRGIVTPLVHFC